MPVDHRTDIYSLGATLYELATGSPLFDAETTHKALGRILVDEPVAPRVVRPGLPRDLETIIMRACPKDATQRYESAVELTDDLRAFIDGQPINARRPSFVEQVGRWLQKNQKMVTTAAITAAVATALLLGTRLAINQYQESITGRVQFATTRHLPNPIVATIVSQDQTKVVPSFTIPTQQPVALPKGDYELQLQTKGEPTDRYRLSVYPNDTDNRAPVVQTHLSDRNVWDPIEISSEWDLWPHKDGARIVVFEDDGVTLLNGATKEQIWRTDLDENRLDAEWSA